MSISNKTGKLAAKLVSKTKAGPSAISTKVKQISSDLREGYHEVVPAKTQNQD